MSDVKERPILFSAPMVRAILDGRKSMTRRIIDPQPIFARDGFGPYCKIGKFEGHNPEDMGWLIEKTCPYGDPPDRLWVRETFTTDRVYKGGDIVDGDTVYRASMPESYTWPDHLDDLTPPKWKPAIHMPRWASRIDLEITGVRVERLQAITPEDAIAEGLVTMPEFNWTAQKPTGRILAETAVSPPYWASPKTAFESLWENINGAGSWEANPFVWVVEFKRIETGEKND